MSALSKNAAIIQQQQKILSSAASNKADALDSPRRLPTLVPVPYRNSKLTHLLKDSLGDSHLLLKNSHVLETLEILLQAVTQRRL